MMQLFCTNEDMNSGILKDNSSSNNADCYLGSNDSCDASPPYRSRCNTWPKLVRGLTSESEISTPPEDAWVGGSLLPLVSEETDELSEITSLDPSSDSCSNNKNIDIQNQSNNALFETNNSNNPSATPNQENSPMPFSTQQFSPSSNHATSSSSTSSSSTLSTRRNPWGNCSYADLITQAIQSSPDQRLTVSQIYEWLVKNISFFSDKGDSNSSAGWKNSIRHNLSLHPKFVRVQNEGTGKSSWWIINPDVKPGVKPSRRRAMSMETSSARQRKNNLGAARAKRRNISGDHHFHHIHHSTTASQLERTLSSGSLPPYDYSDHSDHFRPRASSSASSCGRPGSPRLMSSSVDVLNSSGIHSNANISSLTNNGNPWNNNTNGNGSSLSPTLFSVVEKLNLQDSMEGEASAEQSGDNLENIKLNDLNLDYETTKLLDSFLSSPTGDELGCQSGRSEKEFVPITQQKIKILEQRESTSRGSSMSTSTPSSPPGMNTQNTYSNSFIHQPKIEEDQSSPPTYYGGGNSEMMDTTYSSTEEQQQILQPSTEMSIFSEQFKSFDDVFFENNDNSYTQDFSLNYFTSAQDNKIPPISPNSNTNSSKNKNNNLAPVTLNSY